MDFSETIEYSEDVDVLDNEFSEIKRSPDTTKKFPDLIIISSSSSDYENEEEVVVTIADCHLTPTDLGRLQIREPLIRIEDRWLNDKVIDAFFHLIKERSINDPSLPSVGTTSVFFYTTLAKKDKSTRIRVGDKVL